MKVLKIIGAVLFGILTFTGFILVLSPSMNGESEVSDAMITTVCGILTFLLIRSIRKPTTPKQQVITNAPEETLRDMKRHYSAQQAQQNYQLMKDSFELLQKTTDFETFTTRLNLMQRMAYTLIQARQAKCRGVDKFASGAETVLSQVDNLKVRFLVDTYEKEISSAQQLKTQSGRNKRLTKFLEQLQEHELDFDTVIAYEQIVEKVKSSIVE